MVSRVSAPPFSGRQRLATPDLISPKHVESAIPPSVAPKKEADLSFEEARQAGKTRKLKVKIVDPFALRNRNMDWQEFGNFATHLQFDDIPVGEVWIAEATPEDEREYYTIAAQAQYWAHDHQGVSSDGSYDYGLAIEASERERDTHGRGGARPYHHEVPQDLYLTLWKIV